MVDKTDVEKLQEAFEEFVSNAMRAGMSSIVAKSPIALSVPVASPVPAISNWIYGDRHEQ